MISSRRLLNLARTFNVFWNLVNMFLRILRAKPTTPVRRITVDAEHVLTADEVPNDKARMWISYFASVASPIEIMIMDNTLTELDELDILAREEEGTKAPEAITKASKRTLT